MHDNHSDARSPISDRIFGLVALAVLIVWAVGGFASSHGNLAAASQSVLDQTDPLRSPRVSLPAGEARRIARDAECSWEDHSSMAWHDHPATNGRAGAYDELLREREEYHLDIAWQVKARRRYGLNEDQIDWVLSQQGDKP